jgi:hypothetical protein
MAKIDKPVTDSSRQGRRGDLKSQTQQRQPAASRDGTPGSQQNRRAVKSNQGVGKQQEIQQNAPAATPQLIQQEHVPMNGFNAADVIAMMKSGVDAKVAVYKPEGKDATTKSSPWGTKGELGAFHRTRSIH